LVDFFPANPNASISYLERFLVLMILASGDLFPLRWWSRMLPGLDLFRHPSIFRFMGLFAAIVLGAISLSRIIKNAHGHFVQKDYCLFSVCSH
jgi:hypothetical protein